MEKGGDSWSHSGDRGHSRPHAADREFRDRKEGSQGPRKGKKIFEVSSRILIFINGKSQKSM